MMYFSWRQTPTFATMMVDVWVLMSAGGLGYFMRRCGFGAAPFEMGLVLGPPVKESLSQSMIVFDNHWWPFRESPIVWRFGVLTLASLGWPMISALRRSWRCDV